MKNVERALAMACLIGSLALAGCASKGAHHGCSECGTQKSASAEEGCKPDHSCCKDGKCALKTN